MTVVAKRKNYAIWYLQNAASNQLTQAVKACIASGLDEFDIRALVQNIHDEETRNA
jgi:hypothetical protein